MTGLSIPHIWLPYSQMLTTPQPLRAAKTAGNRIILDDGSELIDAVSSWWTACHGYNHPHIIMAMEKQLRDMPHIMFGGLVHEQAERLAERLTTMLSGPYTRVFFADSGSVAVEVALKIAVQYWLNNGNQARTRFLSFEDGYHGDTLGAMSVTDPNEGMHSLFGSYLPEQIFSPIPHDDVTRAKFEHILESHKHQIAAVIIEPLVQCAGGMKMHDPNILKLAADTAQKIGALFICDEIAVNFGRTGNMFAHHEAKITPDIICLGKALTGGTINLAATVTTSDVFDAFLSSNPDKALMHGPTYMASPLACAAANASLDLFDTEPRLHQVSMLETGLKQDLAPLTDLPGVHDIRVKGAIGAIEVKELHNIEWLKAQFIEAGVWLRPFGNVVYTMPPFTTTLDELSTITAAMRKILPRWAEMAP